MLEVVTLLLLGTCEVWIDLETILDREGVRWASHFTDDRTAHGLTTF